MKLGSLIYHRGPYGDHVGVLLYVNYAGGTVRVYDTVEQEEVWFVASECSIISEEKYEQHRARIEYEVKSGDFRRLRDAHIRRNAK